MKFFQRFSAPIDQLADDLINKFSQQYPIELVTKKSNQKIKKKLNTAISSTYSVAENFQKDHKLGIYGKARLAKKFKSGLEVLGYPDSISEEIMRGLLVLLSTKK